MRRLSLIPILIVLTSCANSSPPGIEQKTHKECLKASDYMGCVENMSQSKNDVLKECIELKQGLAIVKERLISVTLLTKLDINTNPLSDALAIAKVKSPQSGCSKLLVDSQNILEMIKDLKKSMES